MGFSSPLACIGVNTVATRGSVRYWSRVGRPFRECQEKGQEGLGTWAQARTPAQCAASKAAVWSGHQCFQFGVQLWSSALRSLALDFIWV